MPYWCADCRSYFSVRTGTAPERSKVPLRAWAIAIYLEITSLKNESSMKLHRNSGVSQPTAWLMLHRDVRGWQDQRLTSDSRDQSKRTRPTSAASARTRVTQNPRCWLARAGGL